MKNRIVSIVALTLAICLALTGCAKGADSQEAGAIVQVGGEQSNSAPVGGEQSNDARTDDAQGRDAPLTGWRLPPENITGDPTMVTEATPDTLEGTAWMLRDGANAENSMALFFKDGIMTFVRADTCYGTSYDYAGTQLEAYHGDDVVYGEAMEGSLYVSTNDRDGESIARWTTIEEAMELARELNGSFTAPFTPEALGIYFDAPYDEDPYEGMEGDDASEGAVVIDDGSLFVKYIRKEYQKNGNADVPSLLMYIESNYSDTIQIQVAGAVDGRTDQGRFILKDLDDQWTMMGVVVPPAAQFNTSIAFLVGSVFTEQMTLEEYVNIDLRILVYDEAGFDLIKEYDIHIDGDAASDDESAELTSGYVRFECDLFTSEIPADWRVITTKVQYVVTTIEQPHSGTDPYSYMEVVCGVMYGDVLEQRYQKLVKSGVSANFYETTIGGQPVKVLERGGSGASAREIAAVTPSGVGYRLNFYCPDNGQGMDLSAIQEVMDHFTEHIQFK